MDHSHHNRETPSNPPETGDDRLAAGLRNHRLKQKEKYHSEYGRYNYALCLMKGRLVVYSNEALGRTVNAGEMIFFPVSSIMSCEALLPSNFTVIFFKRFTNFCERNYVKELCPLRSQNPYPLSPLELNNTMRDFISDALLYHKKLDKYEEYHSLKCEEFLYLLRTLYDREDVAAFMHPIVSRSVDFRLFVMGNYLKVKNVRELVKISNMKRKTFDREFTEEFGETPYKWLLRQKSKHVRYDLSETNDHMQDIMRRYGFSIPPHFTRFCKDYFGNTPLALRRRLRLERNINLMW
jgi:AraC-like DNA-binding protein